MGPERKNSLAQVVWGVILRYSGPKFKFHGVYDSIIAMSS